MYNLDSMENLVGIEYIDSQEPLILELENMTLPHSNAIMMINEPK